MKLLIATGIYPPSIGGPATYSKILFDELPKKGIEVVVVSFDEVRHLPKILSYPVYFARVFFGLVKSDIIFALDPMHTGFSALIASIILRKRFFLRVSGDYAWEQGVQRFGVSELLEDFVKKPMNYYRLPVRILRSIEYFVARRAERVVVPSESLEKILLKWGVSENKIKVINNAFEWDSSVEVAEKSKIMLSGRAIVSAGRLVPWKGFMALVETMVELVKKFPDLKLYVIGDGPEREKIERRIKQLELESNVYLVGKVSQPILFEYISQASVYAQNTGYESFPNQILEVLFLGTPVVTTDIGGNKDIMKNGENGLLVPYNDKHALASAIERILRDEELAEKFRGNGRITVAKFTKERMIGELIKQLTIDSKQ